MKHLLIIWLMWNLITFLLMGIDKWKAKHERRRISEKTLLLSCFAMGAIGGGIGMLAFHHKTRKLKFQILVPAAVAVNFLAVAGIAYLTM